MIFHLECIFNLCNHIIIGSLLSICYFETNILFQKSEITPYIIHVHAREGIFDTIKAPIHIHTNMAKASLHMFTKCLNDCKYKTQNGKLISVNSSDPSWFIQDEYYKDKCPWIVPPLDEIDGAARILYPLFKQLKLRENT